MFGTKNTVNNYKTIIPGMCLYYQKFLWCKTNKQTNKNCMNALKVNIRPLQPLIKHFYVGTALLWKEVR